MGLGWCTLFLELLELPFETGRAGVSVRSEWAAGDAVGGHRTLDKTDSPFVPVSHEHSRCARRRLRETATSTANEGTP
jgi:hypothetical protein